MRDDISLKVDTSVKGIILLTLPISFSKLIPELNYLFNAAFLGHMGSKELAMAGITGVYYLIFSAMGYAISTALLAIMSRRAGEDNRDAIFSTLWHGLLVGFLIAFCTIGLTYTGIDSLLVLSGVDREGAEMAGSFLKIRIWGLIFLYAYQTQNAYLISLQKSSWLLYGALGTALINIVLDYALIFGEFGLPELGFNGAAYASVISEFAGFAIVFMVIYLSDITRKYNIHKNWKFIKGTFNLVFTQALPLMGQYAISTASWWVFFIFVNRNYSVTEQAVSQAMRNLFGLSGVFTWAFGSASNTIISNIIGQGKLDEIFKTLYKITLISVVGVLFFVAVMNIFPSAFLSLYGQDDMFLKEGVGPLRIVTMAMVFLCIGIIWLNAVVATGKTVIVFWIELVGIVSYLLYIWLVMEVFHASHSMAWMSEWLYWTVMMVLSVGYLVWGNWRKDLQSYEAS
jgi:MATE family multidrug resistance protein